MTCSIEELNNEVCKWPIGDPQHDDFHFCGGKAPASDSVYCEFHRKMAYREGYKPKNQQNKRAA